MVETYVFGHKSPDSDSITSSLVMTNLEHELGNADAKAYRLGNINKETEFILNYLGMEAPELLEGVEDGADVILVDHNSPAESVDNLENANILKVVDHHKLALETSYPLFLRFEPVGCTETILCKLYEENGVEITKEDLSSFSIDEILALDAKQIDFKDVKSIVNQVNTADISDVMAMKDDLEEGMSKIIEEEDLDLFMLLITDIVNSNSQVIALGKSACLVEKAYGVKLEDNTVLLEGVVSRKKQVVPIMTENA